MMENSTRGRGGKKKRGKGKAAKEKKCRTLLLSILSLYSLSLSLSLLLQKNSSNSLFISFTCRHLFTLSCLKCTFETNPTSVRTSPSLFVHVIRRGNDQSKEPPGAIYGRFDPVINSRLDIVLDVFLSLNV